MIKKIFIILTILSAALASKGGSCLAQEMYQSASWYKSITTSRDSTVLPGKMFAVKKGAVTNEDIAFPLYVYFCYPGTYKIDTASRVAVLPGKTLYFATEGKAIFRVSTESSGFKKSQIILGRGFDLTGPKKDGRNFDGRNFTGAIITGFDLTGASFVGCNFTNAVIQNCIIKNCDFTDATGVTDEYLRDTASIYLPDGSGYDFQGVQGDTISK